MVFFGRDLNIRYLANIHKNRENKIEIKFYVFIVNYILQENKTGLPTIQSEDKNC